MRLQLVCSELEECLMRVEYINPFVEASHSILSEILESEVKHGQLFLKTASQSILGLVAVVGLAGDVEGRVLFDMEQSTALRIASKMNNEEFKVIDDMVRSTISELANMVTGRAITKLQELNFRFDITPPVIFTGRDMEIALGGIEALIVPLETNCGLVEINVAIREHVN